MPHPHGPDQPAHHEPPETDRHTHTHTHLGEHSHVHDGLSGKALTPWVLFVIFVFGPCEPLIPLLMYPAAGGGWGDLFIVTAVFGGVTTATMLAAVFLGKAGVVTISPGAPPRRQSRPGRRRHPPVRPGHPTPGPVKRRADLLWYGRYRRGRDPSENCLVHGT